MAKGLFTKTLLGGANDTVEGIKNGISNSVRNIFSLDRFVTVVRDIVNDELESLVPDLVEDALESPAGTFQTTTHQLNIKLDNIYRQTLSVKDDTSYIRFKIDKIEKKNEFLTNPKSPQFWGWIKFIAPRIFAAAGVGAAIAFATEAKAEGDAKRSQIDALLKKGSKKDIEEVVRLKNQEIESLKEILDNTNKNNVWYKITEEQLRKKRQELESFKRQYHTPNADYGDALVQRNYITPNLTSPPSLSVAPNESAISTPIPQSGTGGIVTPIPQSGTGGIVTENTNQDPNTILVARVNNPSEPNLDRQWVRLIRRALMLNTSQIWTGEFIWLQCIVETGPAQGQTVDIPARYLDPPTGRKVRLTKWKEILNQIKQSSYSVPLPQSSGVGFVSPTSYSRQQGYDFGGALQNVNYTPGGDISSVPVYSGGPNSGAPMGNNIPSYGRSNPSKTTKGGNTGGSGGDYTQGPPVAGAAPGYLATREEVENYIIDAAKKRGLNPQEALDIYHGEGAGNWQSQVPRKGKGSRNGLEDSYGPYQLFMGGGLGNDASKYFDVRDPKTWRQNIDFALDHYAKHGAGAWYGAPSYLRNRKEPPKNATALGNYADPKNYPDMKRTATSMDGEFETINPQQATNTPRSYDRRKGAPGEFNYAVSPKGLTEFGGTKPDMTTIRTNGGKELEVNTKIADKALGFLNELESRGYNLRDISAYSNRLKAGGSGLSTHATATSIDINPNTNAFGGQTTDMPDDIEKLAWKYGFSWGGRFGDPMHFETMSPNLAARRKQQLVAEGYMKPIQTAKQEPGDSLVRKDYSYMGGGPLKFVPKTPIEENPDDHIVKPSFGQILMERIDDLHKQLEEKKKNDNPSANVIIDNKPGPPPAEKSEAQKKADKSRLGLEDPQWI